MPNREQRRHGDKKDLGKWLHVEDADGNPFDIYMRDISGKDEFEFLQMTGGTAGKLTDMFFKNEPSLVNIAGLIWAVRRKFEKKLTVMDVLSKVNMACIETMELHDPEDEDDEEDEQPPASRNGQGSPGFGERTPSNSTADSAVSPPASVPSTA